MALDQPEDNREMGFLDHLEELRWHLVRSVISILVFSVLAFLASDFVFETLIFGPVKPEFWTYQQLCRLSEALNSASLCIDEIPISFQNREMTGQFTMHIMSSLVIGLILAFPYTFWEIWRFVKPGLRDKEKSASRGAVLVVSMLFLMGVLFGYFIVTPLSINFLANYRLSNMIENIIDIKSIMGMEVTLVLACGFMFQLPVVSYFLAKAGLVSSALMKSYRKHAFVAILVISAVITPPDVMSQILVALPITLLYEISIVITKRVEKRNQEESIV